MAGAALDTNVVVQNYPAVLGQAITPSDSADIPATRGIYVGSGGNLVALMAGEPSDAATTTFTGVVAGAVYPIRVRRVLTASSASSLVALY